MELKTPMNLYKYVMPTKPNNNCLRLLREKYGQELEVFTDEQTLIFKFEKFVILRYRYYWKTEWGAMRPDGWHEFMIDLGLTPFMCDEWPCVEIPHNEPTLEWINVEHESFKSLPQYSRNSYKSALKLDNGALIPVRAKLFRILEMRAQIQYATEGCYCPEIHKLEKPHYNLAGLRDTD